MSGARDLIVELHIHLDCSPPYTEYDAWLCDDEISAEIILPDTGRTWFARGTSSTPEGALDSAFSAYRVFIDVAAAVRAGGVS